MNSLLSADQFFSGQSDITRYLPKQRRGNIPSTVIGYSGRTAIRMSKLHVRTALANTNEALLN
jgi:hypothetical protein